MTEKLKQTIKEEMVKLPKENQEAINSLDWTSITEEIGKKYLLNESEIHDFLIETLLVLVGLEDYDLYKNNVENNVGTSKDEAEKMVEETTQKIFTPINNILIENIKKNLSTKKPAPEQTLNFILSGGDYSALIAPTSASGIVSTPDTNSTPPTLSDIKDNVQKANTNNASKRMTDLRSTFKI